MSWTVEDWEGFLQQGWHSVNGWSKNAWREWLEQRKATARPNDWTSGPSNDLSGDPWAAVARTSGKSTVELPGPSSSQIQWTREAWKRWHERENAQKEATAWAHEAASSGESLVLLPGNRTERKYARNALRYLKYKTAPGSAEIPRAVGPTTYIEYAGPRPKQKPSSILPKVVVGWAGGCAGGGTGDVPTNVPTGPTTPGRWVDGAEGWLDVPPTVPRDQRPRILGPGEVGGWVWVVGGRGGEVASECHKWPASVAGKSASIPYIPRLEKGLLFFP